MFDDGIIVKETYVVVLYVLTMVVLYVLTMVLKYMITDVA